MHDSTTVFLINDDVRAVKGRYWPEGQTPSRDRANEIEIFKTFDQTISVGDKVVVETDSRHKMTVVEITEVDYDINFEADKDVRWVIQKVDKPAYDALIEQEREAIATVKSAEKRRKREELKAALFADKDAKIKALSLAKSNE